MGKERKKLELIPVVSVSSDDVDNEEPYPGGPYRRVFSIGIGKKTVVDLVFPRGKEDTFRHV